MDWEVINGITGIIGAISAIGSIGYISTRAKERLDDSKLISTFKFVSFLLACSGWILLCFAYLWVFEPYGWRPDKYDYQQLFGVIISFPAIIIFVFGLKLMGSKKYNKSVN